MAQPGDTRKTVKEGFLCGNPAAAPFADLDDFYARGQLAHLEEFVVHEPADLVTRILIPVREPDYARASLEDAAHALGQTPDPDFAARLMLADHVHPMAPWLQQTRGLAILSESSDDGVVLLYRPRPGDIARSVAYEWCNLLRMYKPEAAELFSLTAALEDFVDLETGETIEDQRIAWNALGRLLITQQDETVFALCVRFPLKAAIFGRALVASLVDVADFRQTARYEFFLDRAKSIDFSASAVGLDALKKFPDQSGVVEKLTAFLGQQELLRSIQRPGPR